MDEVKSARLRLFIIILVIAVLVHLGLWFILMGGDSGKGNDSSEETATEQKEVDNNSQNSGSTTGTDATKGGDATGKNTADLTAKSDAYRVPSKSPNFGAPLDFSSARHNNIAIPGIQGVDAGIIVDMDTRKVLWEKNSERQYHLASMVKMMTILLSMEAIDASPDLTLDTVISVPNEVRSVHTGMCYLVPNESIPLKELLMATTIKSANDAATSLGVYFGGGDLGKFVAKMNSRAKEIGMTNTHFTSPCGLPDKERGISVGTARDMVILGERLLEYPVIMEFCGTKHAMIRGGKSELTNTNKLINPHWPGVDGLKTGYTQAAGSCLTFSALRHNRRIVGCVIRGHSSRERDFFCRHLINWAYGDKIPVKNIIGGGSSVRPTGKSATTKKSTKKKSKTSTKKSTKKTNQK